MATKFKVFSFAGGIQRRTSKFLVAEDEVNTATNAEFEIIGAIKKRAGYTQFGNAIATGSQALGMKSFKKTDGNIYFYVVSGSDIYLYNTGTGAYDAQSQGLTAGKEADMSVFGDFVFHTNGFDAPRTHNGSSWSTVTMTTSAPTAYYNYPFLDRMYMARTTANPSRVFFSGLLTAGVITWDAANDWIDVYPDDGSFVRGIISNNDRLFIFKDRSVHTWDLYNLVTISHAVGTLSRKTVVNLGRYTVFLDRRGVYITQGDRPLLISEKVYDYIESMTTTQLEAAWAFTINNSYYLFIGTTGGLTNGMLKYNLIHDTWTAFELADNFTFGTRHEVSGLLDVYAGTNDGDIMKMWDGLTDDGTAVDMEVITKWYWPGGPETFANFKEFIAYSDLSDSTDIFVMTEEEAAFPGSADGTLTDTYTKINITDRGRGVRYKFTDSATDERVEIYGFTQTYKPGEVL